MQTYIALLRGINVSGQKKIKMADLRAHCEALGFEAVQTYIQSGNIVFQSGEKDPGKLEAIIEEKIQKEYGFEVSVLIRKPGEFSKILENNPFLKRGEDPNRLAVTFLAEQPSPDRLEKLKEYDYSPEAYAIEGRTLYYFAPNGFGRAKMSNNFFESKLKVACTTRNWKSVNVLADMARNL